MARSNLARAAARTLRTSSSVTPRRSLLAASKPIAGGAATTVPAATIAARRLFTTSSPAARGIMPDTDNPQVKETPKSEVKTSVAELTDAEYHELADAYLETVVTKLEEIQDEKDGVDVEFAVRFCLPVCCSFVLDTNF